MKTEQIAIEKKELPELKRWLDDRHKKILEIIELGKNGVRVIISKD